MDSKVLDYSQTSEEILNFNPSTNYDSEESRKNRIKYLEAVSFYANLYYPDFFFSLLR